jgi:hypothetical protein
MAATVAAKLDGAFLEIDQPFYQLQAESQPTLARTFFSLMSGIE